MKSIIEPVGIVEITTFKGGKIYDKMVFRNTVVKSGRRHIAAALGGNLLTERHEAFVNRVAFGDQGTNLVGSTYVPKEVSETRTSLFNKVLETTALAHIGANGEPHVTFQAAVGEDTPSANNKVLNEMGLMFATDNDEFFAITTWKGLAKDAETSFVVDWTILFL